MSRALMTLLGRPSDKMLEISFDDLEKATGKQAIDAQLVGDILHAAHGTIRELGLEGDVTAKELYQALRVHEDMLDDSTAFVGLVIDKEVVSLNAQDIAHDHSEAGRFETRSLVHLRKKLTSEIVKRYTEWAAHPELLEPITRHIQLTHKETV
ncbi:MAG: hypothetical protein UY35_C0005G0112 [Candidatus Saccharibacteria bacterium GW2011_GWC2_48_9]|nr:MAG: hypothetical protein UY35_C0005G0112 [Candidatus Saccharibacteria bacterium GW2011_GWC2_48_9]